MYNVVGQASTPEVKRYLHTITDKVQSLKVHSYRKWWTDRGINIDNIIVNIFKKKLEIYQIFTICPQKYSMQYVF